jgi:cell division protein FtsW (lipid II flippase)
MITIIAYNQFFPYINALVPKYASIIIDRINIWQNPWLYTKGEQIVRSLWAIKAADYGGPVWVWGIQNFFRPKCSMILFLLHCPQLGLAAECS